LLFLQEIISERVLFPGRNPHLSVVPPTKEQRGNSRRLRPAPRAGWHLPRCRV